MVPPAPYRVATRLPTDTPRRDWFVHLNREGHGKSPEVNRDATRNRPVYPKRLSPSNTICKTRRIGALNTRLPSIPRDLTAFPLQRTGIEIFDNGQCEPNAGFGVESKRPEFVVSQYMVRDKRPHVGV